MVLPDGPIPRSETCPKCNANVKVCRNCTFYDTAAYNECREPSADRVVDKEKSNFCDYFTPGGKGQDKNSAAEDARKKLDDLFK